MLTSKVRVARLAGMILWTTLATLNAQSVQPQVSVPRTVRYSGFFHPANGLPLQPVEGVTMSIYREEQGGVPLWQETQNVNVDTEGRYSVLMGATLNDGMPLELFTAGEPRWLGVQFQRTGEVEQPRVLLTSVPYALKAADADTLGGQPASSYLLSPAATATGTPSTTAPATTGAVPATKSPKPLTLGTSNFIGVFTDSTDLGNSVMYQLNGLIGVGTTQPLISLDARTGTFPQMGIAGTTDYLTFFASDSNGPAIYWDPGKDMRFGKGGAGLYNPYGFVEQMRIQSSTGNVGIGTMTPGSKLDVAGDLNLSGSLRKGGMLFLHNLGSGGANTAVGLNALSGITTGSNNTAVGYYTMSTASTGVNNTAVGQSALGYNTADGETAVGAAALALNTTGSGNTAVGFDVLYANTTGASNTAVGYDALVKNTTGANNTAVGYNALISNTAGELNVALGSGALADATGSGNTAVGEGAGYLVTSGATNTFVGYLAGDDPITSSENTGLGAFALYNLTSGGSNIGLGYGAGQNLGTGSNNIDIGHPGLSTDANIIRIGTPGTQTAAYIAGIWNNGTGGNTVYANSAGQLSTMPSSRRFKQDIRDMGDTTDVVMGLRPVRFRYKAQGQEGPEQYGLIAEEVEGVAPELVAYGQDGQIDSVYYDKVNAMLLNQVQKEHRELQEQKQHARQQDEIIRQQQEQNRKLEARLAALEALLSSKVPTTATAGQ
jgi:hypothetical protein